MSTTLNEFTVRSRAKHLGYSLRKSRRAEGIDNFGGYMLVDADRNFVVAGERYDLTLENASYWLATKELEKLLQ